jgi:hypothetical protein
VSCIKQYEAAATADFLEKYVNLDVTMGVNMYQMS